MKQIWIVGAGLIAREYAKVLDALGYEYSVIGRGVQKAEMFMQATGHSCIPGGLAGYISSNPAVPEYAIVATNLSSLAENCITLMEFGVKKIFCEKPGFQYPSELENVLTVAKKTSSRVFCAYNRRFFSSVLKAREIIASDGGVKSFSFEFTEWLHVIEKIGIPENDMENLFYANSSHVMDLAFHLGGKPVEMETFFSTENVWHNQPVIFAGAGITDRGAFFTYSANWKAPGRWGVEILTSVHRLYLRPLEKLQIQEMGSVEIKTIDVDDSLDGNFKPGFYLETKSFIEGDYSCLCSIEEQYQYLMEVYSRINK